MPFSVNNNDWTGRGPEHSWIPSPELGVFVFQDLDGRKKGLALAPARASWQGKRSSRYSEHPQPNDHPYGRPGPARAIEANQGLKAPGP